MPPPSDLIEHFRLETQWHEDHTVHVSYRSERSRGRQKVRVEEKWYRKHKLGQGSFGSVWLETSSNGDERAVKEIQTANAVIDYNKELLAMAKFSKSEDLFVVFHGWFKDPKNIFLAMEYFPLGDLDACLGEVVSEHDAREITKQLLEGLAVMHKEGFTHRDLKPKNVFVVSKSPSWWVKIGDFGISKRIENDSSTALRTQIGTLLYRAPETMGYIGDEDDDDDEYTNAVDLWGIGCMAYLMLTRELPFPDLKKLSTFCKGRTSFPAQKLIEKSVSEDGCELTKALLEPKPTGRPAVEKALRYKWFVNSETATIRDKNTANPANPTSTSNLDPKIGTSNVKTKHAAKTDDANIDIRTSELSLSSDSVNDTSQMTKLDDSSLTLIDAPVSTTRNPPTQITGPALQVASYTTQYLNPAQSDDDNEFPKHLTHISGLDESNAILELQAEGDAILYGSVRKQLNWAVENGHNSTIRILARKQPSQVFDILSNETWRREAITILSHKGHLDTLALILGLENSSYYCKRKRSLGSPTNEVVQDFHVREDTVIDEELPKRQGSISMKSLVPRFKCSITLERLAFDPLHDILKELYLRGISTAQVIDNIGVVLSYANRVEAHFRLNELMAAVDLLLLFDTSIYTRLRDSVPKRKSKLVLTQKEVNDCVFSLESYSYTGDPKTMELFMLMYPTFLTDEAQNSEWRRRLISRAAELGHKNILNALLEYETDTDYLETEIVKADGKNNPYAAGRMGTRQEAIFRKKWRDNRGRLKWSDRPMNTRNRVKAERDLAAQKSGKYSDYMTDGRPALEWAITNGFSSIVHFLLQSKAPNVLESFQSREWRRKAIEKTTLGHFYRVLPHLLDFVDLEDIAYFGDGFFAREADNAIARGSAEIAGYIKYKEREMRSGTNTSSHRATVGLHPVR